MIGEAVHVVPVEDGIGHTPNGCVCGPDYWCRIDFTDHGDHAHLAVSGWMVTHHSLDGRERTETGPDGGTSGPGWQVG